MKWSELLLPTLKETPKEAEAISHILMIRAGLIRKLTSGVYSYLPLGLKVLKKVERIITEEMNKKGAQQVLLPAIQPAELWMKTGRFDSLGEDMIKFSDRHKKLNILGPTHEEVITNLVKNEVSSYRQLPLILYQIQTKFRDEARPRFGIIRSREFIMKDAYSFDADLEGLNKSYQQMYEAYCAIFARCGLDYTPVEADTGVMGGDVSHEFMVIAENGEDRIARCQACEYAASFDKAECAKQVKSEKLKVKSEKQESLQEVETPGASSVKDVAAFLNVKTCQLVKTIIYLCDEKPLAVLVRGDHEVNEAKLNRVLKCKKLIMADEELIKQVTNGPLGFSGPIGLRDVQIISDYALEEARDVVVGANKADKHIIGVDIERDVQVSRWADIRNVTEEDVCPRCRGKIKLSQAIEVGHVFKLGTKYTESLQASYLDEQGVSRKIIMGCYGIGVTRIIAACIEQNNDEHGIIWPFELSPFQVLIMALNPLDKKSMSAAEKIYRELTNNNVEVLFDERDVRPGIKFKDADLIGIPIQVIIGEKNLSKGLIEIKLRRERTKVLSKKIDEAPQEILKIIQSGPR